MADDGEFPRKCPRCECEVIFEHSPVSRMTPGAARALSYLLGGFRPFDPTLNYGTKTKALIASQKSAIREREEAEFNR